jgi:ubiquinone/menaquinone biosynthesis C-methylase UbiE
MQSPDYSPYAKQYAESRPQYPEELFKYLSDLSPGHNVAWDCATGNGQAAMSLAGYFERVIASDMSLSQIQNAASQKQINYFVAHSENAGLKSHSIDLLTVASAVHWFNLEKFFSEAVRVLKPGGILAVWTYHVGHVEPPFQKLFYNFYTDVLSSYFNQGARLVDRKYTDLKLPGKQIESENLFVSVDWNLTALLNFIESWSGIQQYRVAKGNDPVELIEKELKELWGEPESVHNIRWPLYLRISRV